MKKVCLISLSLLLAGYLQADTSIESDYKHEKIIGSSSDLKEWCENESSMYYLAKDITPYNWRASWSTKGNFITVEGVWRVNGADVEVTCRARRGVSERYATLRIKE